MIMNIIGGFQPYYKLIFAFFMISDIIVYKLNIIKLVVIVALLTFDKYIRICLPIYLSVNMWHNFGAPVHHNNMI